MRVHRILDRQFVQAEDVRDRLHLVFVGFVQPDPHVGRDAGLLQLVHLLQGGAVGVFAGQSHALGVDGAVDHRARDGHVNRVGVRVDGSGLRRRSEQGWLQAAERGHALTSDRGMDCGNRAVASYAPDPGAADYRERIAAPTPMATSGRSR